MKFIWSELAYLMEQPEARRNLKVLAKLCLLLLGLIALWTVLFHVIMVEIEGRDHSWFTGLYWTMTVMTTLGFGDITFHSDIGRIFSTVVLVSGVVFLLIVLPFAFIRFFYAPWLEAQIRLRAPRVLPASTRGHIVFGRYDTVADGLISNLRQMKVPYVVIVPDFAEAARLHSEGISVIAGDPDRRETHAGLQASHARLLVANLGDADNTNLTLTFREEAASVPVVALVESWDSVDVLELSGANHVIPIKHHLGQQLASRVPAGRSRAQIVGRFRQLMLAELAIQGTPFEGQRIRDTQLRQRTGLNIVGVWERSRFVGGLPDHVLSAQSVAILVGTQQQLNALDQFCNPVEAERLTLVLGAGKVGRAATRALHERGVRVHLIDRNETVARRATDLPDQLFVGDAADRDVLMAAGLPDATAVVLTTNDDATNIYLSIYCRRLNPTCRIVSRITHDKNVEAMQRAGADFVLSYTTLAVRSLVSLLLGRELVMLGAGAELHVVRVPPSLVARTLAESQIGAKTGLNVIALERHGGDVVSASGALVLAEHDELLMIGTPEQGLAFQREYGDSSIQLVPLTSAQAA